MPLSADAVPVDAVAAAYDRWSHSYEAVDNATRDLAAWALRHHGLALLRRDVLEIGCGTGLNTGYLAEHCKQLVAMDFSTGMLEQARSRCSAPHVRFEQRDIRHDWGLGQASMDLVVCMLVLEHIDALTPIFAQAARVLRPDGEMLVCELHPYRQLAGSQARFNDSRSGQLVLVPAWRHDVSDYLNDAVHAGLRPLRMQELRDPGQDRTAPPRLLSLLLGR